MATLIKDLKVSKVGAEVAPRLGHDAKESIKTYIDDLVWDEAQNGQASWVSQWEDHTDAFVKKAKQIKLTTLGLVPKPKKKAPVKKKQS